MNHPVCNYVALIASRMLPISGSLETVSAILIEVSFSDGELRAVINRGDATVRALQMYTGLESVRFQRQLGMPGMKDGRIRFRVREGKMAQRACEIPPMHTLLSGPGRMNYMIALLIYQ
jgi:hypothetical protein